MAELVRRLDDAVRAIENLSNKLERSYVNKDVYLANRVADDRRFEDIEGDMKSAADFRRQAITTFALTAVGWLIAVGLGVINILAR
jgi:hypothetical protein